MSPIRTASTPFLALLAGVACLGIQSALVALQSEAPPEQPADAAPDSRAEVMTPVEVDGYGPWRLGMSPDEVRAVAEHGPYTPVQSTGGLETANGTFQGEPANVSFVFGPSGLYHLQLWVYEGRDPEAAEEAFHRAYRWLSERFGALQVDGRPVPEDLDREGLAALVPASFRGEGTAADLEAMEPGDALELGPPERVHLHPRVPVENAQVYASFLHSRQLGTYWVFVYLKTPPA